MREREREREERGQRDLLLIIGKGHFIDIFNTFAFYFQDCLSVLSKFCNLDIKKTDRWRRSVTDVATPICNQFLSQLGKCIVHSLSSPLSLF